MKRATAFQCRSCGAADGSTVLDLGLQPLANSLVPAGLAGKPERRCKLVLNLCRACRLLQLGEIVSPEDLFSEYVYFSSFSNRMLEHAATYVEDSVQAHRLTTGSFVVEIASNDGYLLKHFVSRGIPCLGVEPAHNVAAAARTQGVDTIEAFFGLATAERIAERRQADLVVANNVFAHAPDPNDFVAGISRLLSPKGVATLEFPWAAEMLRSLEFDTIYHEHVFYYAAMPLVPLLHRHGLELVRVDVLPLHGGSLRASVAHRGARPVGESVPTVLETERRLGLNEDASYEAFATRVGKLRDELVSLLRQLKADGARIAAYGASAKGSTLLNYCDLGTETIDFIVDRSPHKQGFLSPGKQIPILPSTALLERHPDYALLLTWNFADEILSQQRAYRNSGGRFIVPVPFPRIVE
jgi:SAM-dependent methyltransferase